MAVFFERFRTEVAKYADGVHQLGEPARAEAVAGLPDELAAFLRSFDGATLFIDAVTIHPAAGCERDGDLLLFGATAAGDRLALGLAAAGRAPVLKIEEDTGEVLVEGTGFARWLEAFVVAEGTLYDREGEFREDVFEDDGEELDPAASERRERRALKIDPLAPAPAWRLAHSLVRLGQDAKARELLAGLASREPRFGWAWFDLGKLERAAGHLAEAERAFAGAAEADPTYEHAGYFAAHAARAAAARADEAARVRLADRALTLDPDLARAQRDAALRLLEEERPVEALEAAEIAAALAPLDLAILDVVRRARGGAA